MKIGFLVLFVSSLFLFTNATSCYAIYGNSTNYEMPISNINFYCSDEHSTNYNVDLSFVDQWVGTNGSAHYNGSFGFYGAVNYTGYSTGGPFDISINAPASVTASSTVTADVQLINQNPGFGEDAFLEYWIIDSSNKNIGSGSKTVYVGAPTTVETMVSLTAPSTTGTYTYVARVTWSTVYTANASDTFTVTSAPGGGDGGGDGGGGASGTRYVPVLMITEYPKNISLERSDFGHYVVEVSNIGGATAVNAFLQILNLSQCCFFSIEPDGINIEKNTSESFALRINVPQDAALGSYNFSIKAIGGSASNEVNSQLNVMEIVQKDVRIVDIYPETLQVNEIGFVRVFVNNTGFGC